MPRSVPRSVSDRIAADETEYLTGSTGSFELAVERYEGCKMGGYVSNRLFCVGEVFSLQSVPDGGDYGISLSGLRAYQGRLPAAPAGFCRCISGSSHDLSDCCLAAAFLLESLFSERPDGKWA